MMPVPDRQKCDDMCIRLDTILRQTDLRTDGQNWYNTIAISVLSMLTRDK